MKSRYGLEIRTAAGPDAAGVCELLHAAGHAIPPQVMAERLEAMRREACAALIAVEWGPPSGLILVHWYRTLEAAQSTAQITMLLVAPDARRRGIGRLLVKAAAQAARVAGCGTLEILALQADASLPGFCLATGFEPVGPRFTRPLRKKG